MRILLVSHGYPPFGVAGVERVTQQTAVALSAAGHDVTVLARRVSAAPPLPRIDRSMQDGIELVWVSGSAPFGRFPGHQERLDRIFERVLLELMPEVVVLGHLINHSPSYVAIAHRWRIPVVLELHDFYTACERAHLQRPSGDLCAGPEGGKACARHCFADQPEAVPRWALRTHLFRRALAEADAVLAPSEFVATYFRERYRSARAIHVIPNGVTCSPGTPVGKPVSSDRGLRLASLGVAVPHKGMHVVVEALRKARLSNVHYTLLGPVTQPYVRELRESAEIVFGLTLRTYGAYDPASLPALLGNVDAVVIPSLVWETFSIVARESMACGVPVIASRLGALPEAIRTGENGLLFTPGASSELAAILQMLHADREHLDALRRGIRNTDWISVAERTRRLEELLVGLCARGVGPVPVDAARSELDVVRDALAY